MATSLSFREKSLYASLVVELLIYGLYFFFNFFNQEPNTVNRIAGMITSVIVLQILLQLLIAALTRNRITDERDRLIELRGYRVGYLTITSLMVLGLALLWLHTAAGNFPMDRRMLGLHFLSVFFSMLVIADIAKTATQIVAYRRAL